MANPLDLRGMRSGDDGGSFDPEGLRGYCFRMNAMNFVIANGWEYFVNRRPMPNGKMQHFVDRRDGNRSMPAQLVKQARAALVPPREPARHPGYPEE